MKLTRGKKKDFQPCLKCLTIKITQKIQISLSNIGITKLNYFQNGTTLKNPLIIHRFITIYPKLSKKGQEARKLKFSDFSN